MSLKQRFSLTDICPFGKALAPPLIILLARMELRQIQCYDSWFHIFANFIVSSYLFHSIFCKITFAITPPPLKHEAHL